MLPGAIHAPHFFPLYHWINRSGSYFLPLHKAKSCRKINHCSHHAYHLLPFTIPDHTLQGVTQDEQNISERRKKIYWWKKKNILVHSFFPYHNSRISLPPLSPLPRSTLHSSTFTSLQQYLLWRNLIITQPNHLGFLVALPVLLLYMIWGVSCIK